jgi:hypothetical protein
MQELDRQFLARQLAVSRRAIPSCEWSAIADLIAADRQRWEQHIRKPEENINRSLFGSLEDLRSKGIVVPPIRLDRRKVTAIREHLDPQLVYRGAHIYGSDFCHRPFSEVQKDSAFAGYTVDQLLRTPHLVDFFNHPAIVDFLEEALGCVPTLYSINAWWSFPGTTATGVNAQKFHRDTDDWRFITLFLYLTDVDEGAGPHQLVAGSHTLAGMTELMERARAGGANEKMPDPVATFSGDYYFSSEFSDFVERHCRESVINVTGTAGTVFMANTVAAHRGLLPATSPRLVVWARYGFGPNTNSVDLEQGPLARLLVRTTLPDTLRNRYVNRLLFEFDRLSGPVPEMPPNFFESASPEIGDESTDVPQHDMTLPLPKFDAAAERSLAIEQRAQAAEAARAEAPRAEATATAARTSLLSTTLNWARRLVAR